MQFQVVAITSGYKAQDYFAGLCEVFEEPGLDRNGVQDALRSQGVLVNVIREIPAPKTLRCPGLDAAFQLSRKITTPTVMSFHAAEPVFTKPSTNGET